jgi:hypothetical protein
MNIIKKGIILEGSGLRQEIRTIVRDIIKIFKEEDEGEFNLPYEIDELKTKYTFPKFELEVELIIRESEEVDDFLLNAEFYREEEIITILIVYNPNNKGNLIYDLIGNLNELVSHELRHMYQQKTGMYDLNVEEPEDPFEYYTQPHELDAQVAGFKRMSKITKKPFEKVVRNWFEKNKDIHGMDDNKKEKVIQKILNY